MFAVRAEPFVSRALARVTHRHGRRRRDNGNRLNAIVRGVYSPTRVAWGRVNTPPTIAELWHGRGQPGHGLWRSSWAVPPLAPASFNIGNPSAGTARSRSAGQARYRMDSDFRGMLRVRIHTIAKGRSDPNSDGHPRRRR